MPRRILTAVTDVGTFTRQTARPYTHVVVCVGREESYLLRRHAEEHAYKSKELAGYLAVIESGKIPPYAGTSSWTPTVDSYREYAANVAHDLAEMPGRHARELERNRQAIDGNRGAALAWSAAAHNAQKAAQYWIKKGYRNVRVLPIVPPTTAAGATCPTCDGGGLEWPDGRGPGSTERPCETCKGRGRLDVGRAQ